MKCREPDFEENLALRNSPLGASVYTKMTTCKSYRSCTDCQVNIEFTYIYYFQFLNTIQQHRYYSKFLFFRKILLVVGVMMVLIVEPEFVCRVDIVVL